ncbi:putative pentatricopeptide repeat-containing protein at3g23330 [Phtheirospermum japonicum]|uniref:Putative pentatricopeptide repeat-containing protein at3g23330 n=1 Tax=Phtheirospermum japonicum TaxID=374723 RepID=A0A830CSV4_9LAMI|nr:putative pentatricopeptide repeat-containing protein at3g23330 [Phtheirospermum japonicum]
MHSLIFKHGFEPDVFVSSALVDMYAKSGEMGCAIKVFDEMPERNLVSWNSAIVGFLRNGCYREAIGFFKSLIVEDVIRPDQVSFSSVLSACANACEVIMGTSIHNQIIKTGFGQNTCVASSLITMYAKCGSLVDARRAFGETEAHNVISWTAMLSAFQQHGCADQVIEWFDDMLRAGLKPDYITFVSVLSACGHTGRVDDGFSYFHLMSHKYNMNPGLEHYACMVDMLGRVGRLHDAKRFVEIMPIKPDVSVWGALLGACRKHGNLDMGKDVAERLFQIEPNNPGNYVLLYNMYALRGKLEEANEVRRLMGFNRVKKEPGCSWLDFKNTTHVFKAHDRSHSMTKEIYEMLGKLEELVKQKGYVPEIQYAVNDVGEHKERSLWHHSEKLALAYGLMILPVGAPIRIKKNLRTCGDCHIVMKFASAIFRREIIIRDINRFHRFADGECSCGDYW